MKFKWEKEKHVIKSYDKIYWSENEGYSQCSALHAHMLITTFTSPCSTTDTWYTQVRKDIDTAIVSRSFPITTLRKAYQSRLYLLHCTLHRITILQLIKVSASVAAITQLVTRSTARKDKTQKSQTSGKLTLRAPKLYPMTLNYIHSGCFQIWDHCHFGPG